MHHSSCRCVSYRHLSNLLYSKETGTMARMLILSALGHAALQLSSKKPFIEGNALLLETTVATVNGSIVRPPQTKVPFSQLVQYFFLPLIGPLAKWSVFDFVLLCGSLLIALVITGLVTMERVLRINFFPKCSRPWASFTWLEQVRRFF